MIIFKKIFFVKFIMSLFLIVSEHEKYVKNLILNKKKSSRVRVHHYLFRLKNLFISMSLSNSICEKILIYFKKL